MTADTLTRRQLNRATLARQLLLARARVPTVTAVERLCGLQAQEAKPPFVGLWTRVERFRRQDLHQALHAREVVRATLLRGTLHLLSAKDYLAFRAPFQPMLLEAMRMLGPRAEGLELDKLLLVARTLLAERPRTFNELRGLLVEAFPEANDRALGYAVRMGLPLVMVPTHDRWAFPSVAAFTLAETWLDAPVSGDGTPEALVPGYLAAFGPATAADMQTWSGLRGLRRVVEGMRPRLRVFEDERGRELFDLPDAPRPDEDVPAPPRFLPEFDNLMLAHADRSRVLPDEYRGLVVTKNLRVRATFLWDGVVRGTWTVEPKKAAATLRLTPFEALPRGAADELAEEGDALLHFVEADATTFHVKLDEPVAST
jgi:Winged helix DNA-binding domain